MPELKALPGLSDEDRCEHDQNKHPSLALRQHGQSSKNLGYDGFHGTPFDIGLLAIHEALPER